MDPSEESPIPAHYAEAAEEVRAHLCALRGGGLFLSPMDTWKLVQWLDRGVRVSDVLVALERAAAARRAARSHLPLALGAAARHLGRPGRSTAPRRPRPGEPALAPLAPPRPEDPALAAAVDRLTRVLHALDRRTEEGERHALAAIRVFLDEAWTAIGDDGRDRLREAARAELGDLLHLVDEPTGHALVEETARDHLRQRWPTLTAASVRDLLADGA